MNVTAVEALKTSLIEPPFRSRKPFTNSMPVESKSPLATTYRNRSVAVPVPFTKVAFRGVAELSMKNWMRGTPLTNTVLEKFAKKSIASSTL